MSNPKWVMEGTRLRILQLLQRSRSDTVDGLASAMETVTQRRGTVLISSHDREGRASRREVDLEVAVVGQPDRSFSLPHRRALEGDRSTGIEADGPAVEITASEEPSRAIQGRNLPAGVAVRHRGTQLLVGHQGLGVIGRVAGIIDPQPHTNIAVVLLR